MRRATSCSRAASSSRKVGGYHLPEHLRITIGTEDEMRAVVAALAEFLAASMSDPLFDRVAFIGIGLIGSSLARRAAARQARAASIVACARRQRDARHGAAR